MAASQAIQQAPARSSLLGVAGSASAIVKAFSPGFFRVTVDVKDGWSVQPFDSGVQIIKAGQSR